MQIEGCLISKEVIRPQPDRFYTKIFIAQEVGYGLDITKVIVFDATPSEQLENINVGAMICAKVFFSSGCYKATSIEVIDLYHCPHCRKPLDNTQRCDGCDNSPQERIEGMWEVRNIKPLSPERSDCIKLILKQNENILGYVTFPSTPFYNILANLEEGETIELQGWRDNQRHTKLSYVYGFTKQEMPTSTASPVQCVECGKDFKNRNSLNSHKSQYHKKL